MGSAYYNEFDPVAAAWLRELIKAGLIPAGDVDERSIEDVKPADLRGYEQCHFFAGIGGWSYALALARWPAGRPVWTGSCPCQPFSAAGKGAGFADQRHLWPAWFHLIRECRPTEILGEQVASKAADDWIDLVQADLEGVGHAFGCVPFPAAGVGSPNIRDRNYWFGVGLADADFARLEGWQGADERSVERAARARGVASWLADMHGDGCEPWREIRSIRPEHDAEHGDAAVGLADPDGSVGGQGRSLNGRGHSRSDAFAWPGLGGGLMPNDGWPGSVNGFWRDADWLACRDGKWRPVEPGSFPLANGIPARVGRLRGYGNAINPYQAAAFVVSYLEAVGSSALEAAA